MLFISFAILIRVFLFKYCSFVYLYFFKSVAEHFAEAEGDGFVVDFDTTRAFPEVLKL